MIEILVRTARVGQRSLTTEFCAQRVRDNALKCTAEQTLALVELAERRPTPIPAEFSSVLRAFEGASLEEAP